MCAYWETNQSELRRLEVKTISVNEAEQSAKIKSVKKQWRKTKCSWYKEKMWGLLRMYATTSENRANERECVKLKRGESWQGSWRRGTWGEILLWISINNRKKRYAENVQPLIVKSKGNGFSPFLRSSRIIIALHRLRLSTKSRDFLHLRWFLAFTIIL